MKGCRKPDVRTTGRIRPGGAAPRLRRIAVLACLLTLVSAALAQRQKEAYLDIGSASTKLILLEPARPGTPPSVEIVRTPIFFLKNLTGDGRFPPEIESEGLARLLEFSERARRAGAVLRDGGATAAFRKADPAYIRNLLAAWSEKTGWGLRVLSAEEEARAGYLAIGLLYPDWKGSACLDMGAGSLQLTAMRGGEFVFQSLPLGADAVNEYLASIDCRPRTEAAVEALAERIAVAVRSWPLPRSGKFAVIGGVGYGLNKALAPAGGRLTEQALLAFAREIGPLEPREIEARYPSTVPYGEEMWGNTVAFLAWMRIFGITEWTFLELETGVGLSALAAREVGR